MVNIYIYIIQAVLYNNGDDGIYICIYICTEWGSQSIAFSCFISG